VSCLELAIASTDGFEKAAAGAVVRIRPNLEANPNCVGTCISLASLRIFSELFCINLGHGGLGIVGMC